MESFFKKLYYYRDIRLLNFIIANIIEVSFTPSDKRLALVDVSGKRDDACPSDKLGRYLTLVCFIMRHLWIRPTCFTRSVAVCRIMKKKGFDARIVFGCEFEKDKLRGHCWVDLGKDSVTDRFRTVFIYP